MNKPPSNVNRWLKKQHVLSWTVAQDKQLWCSNAFYVYDEEQVVFYLLTDPLTRHGQMVVERALVAGSVNGQPKSVALLRGVQFLGDIRCLSDAEDKKPRAMYLKRFPVARTMSKSFPVWKIRIDEIKFTDNTLGFGKKIMWQRD